MQRALWRGPQGRTTERRLCKGPWELQNRGQQAACCACCGVDEPNPEPSARTASPPPRVAATFVFAVSGCCCFASCLREMMFLDLDVCRLFCLAGLLPGLTLLLWSPRASDAAKEVLCFVEGCAPSVRPTPTPTQSASCPCFGASYLLCVLPSCPFACALVCLLFGASVGTRGCPRSRGVPEECKRILPQLLRRH